MEESIVKRNDSTKIEIYRQHKKGVSKMEFQSIWLNNGKIITGEKIGKLVTEIVNKLSEAELSYDEAKMVLEATKDSIGECSTVQKIL